MRKITDERIGRQPVGSVKVNGHGNLLHALEVAHTYPVFPCTPSSKRPMVEGGFQAATQDRETLERWWRRWPEGLIGVPTGARSGLVAIDCDPKGLDWYQSERKRLGDYRLHQTRRGKHLLYQDPGDIRNSAGKLAKGVDVRGEGGYVIWWPAHGGVSVGSPGAMPEWLQDSCRAEELPHQGKANGHAKDWPDEVSEGGRDEWLSARAYSLVKAGWGPTKILETLRSLNETHCKPPLTEKELARIVRGKKKVRLEKDVAVLQRADSIKERPVPWLWRDYLAQGMVHLISGDGGHAKSTVATDLAARLTRGSDWPDGSSCGDPGNVVIWNGEDPLKYTAKPRLRAARADLTRVHFVTGTQKDKEDGSIDFDPAEDMAPLEQAIETIGNVKLVIIDPFASVVAGDNNAANEVRKALLFVAGMAQRTGACVYGVHHYTKNTEGRSPLARVSGAKEFGNVARLVHGVVLDKSDDEQSRLFVRIKSNIGPDGDGYRYKIQPVHYKNERSEWITTTKINWLEPVEGSATELIAAAEAGGDAPKLESAKIFLQTLLSDGPVSYERISQLVQDAKINGRTLRRAKEDLGVVSKKTGGKGIGWAWSLPDRPNSANSEKDEQDQ